jgi:NADH-quinone oxidoreductase subunit L
MRFPLIVLTVLSIVGGGLGVPHFHVLGKWLDPVLAGNFESSIEGGAGEWILMVVTALASLSVLFITLRSYRSTQAEKNFESKWGRLYRFSVGQGFLDGFYDRVIVRGLAYCSTLLNHLIEGKVLKGMLHGLEVGTRTSNGVLSKVQSGSLHVYSLVFSLGILLSIGYIFYGMAH